MCVHVCGFLNLVGDAYRPASDDARVSGDCRCCGVCLLASNIDVCFEDFGVFFTVLKRRIFSSIFVLMNVGYTY